MKILITILSLFFIFISCGQTSSDSELSNKTKAEKKTIYTVETYHYAPLTIPSFFKSLIANHTKDFFELDSMEYFELCEKNDLDTRDSVNVNQFYTIKILHGFKRREISYF